MKRDQLQGDYTEIIGESPQIFEVLQHIEHFAATSIKVLITGDTGTGKGLVAHALHTNSGRSGQMVALNCATIPDLLLENELFGHEEGAFTDANDLHIGKFERAHNGTLFLDEISEMSLTLQPKLLRAIEAAEIERLGGETPIPIDVRIVTATNTDLEQAVSEGRFRADLYYRLNGTVISLPSLSERREDIDALVIHFLEQFSLRSKSGVPQVAPSVRNALNAYPWPGNVRELENVIERAVHLAKGQPLLLEHLPSKFQTDPNRGVHIPCKPIPPEDPQSVTVPLGTPLKEMEEAFIRQTLAGVDGNREQAARVLGIGRSTLQRKLKQYGF